MIKFIKQVLLFTLIIIIINMILNHYGNKIYLKSYAKYSLNYNSYILADSHGLGLGNNFEKHGVYNFYGASDSYFDMKKKLNFLIKNTTVDTIYISVDDHTLSKYREKKNNLDRSVIYSTPQDYESYFQYLKDKLIFNIVFLQPKKRTLLKKYFYSTLKNSNIKHNSNTSWSNKSLVEKLESSNGRFKGQFNSPTGSKNLKKTLFEIIDICRINNIELIGIKFPLSKTYLEILGDKSYGASDVFILKNLKIIDAKNRFINNDNFFLDQDHVNEKGGLELINFIRKSTLNISIDTTTIKKQKK
ncbi:hypothetical protein [Flavicella marina]|uniref:hypothetical protein n=1 Tax=Flavicella marina TaxID=1475951 RepID=UPI001263F135|nr:hypothetical protein [Flavicella marina]